MEMVGKLHPPPPPQSLTPEGGEPSRIHSIDGWLGSTAGLHKVEKSLFHVPGIERDFGLETHDRPIYLWYTNIQAYMYLYETLLGVILTYASNTRLLPVVRRHTTFVTASPIAATCFGCHWICYNKTCVSTNYVLIVA
jgi:hypothetical protein